MHKKLKYKILLTVFKCRGMALPNSSHIVEQVRRHQVVCRAVCSIIVTNKEFFRPRNVLPFSCTHLARRYMQNKKDSRISLVTNVFGSLHPNAANTFDAASPRLL